MNRPILLWLACLIVVATACRSLQKTALPADATRLEDRIEPSAVIQTETQEAVFDQMPPPAFRSLTYQFTEMTGRRSLTLTLVTNQGALAELNFLNHLPHGINPGHRTGYGDFLSLATVSTNTVPNVRTIQHVTNSIESAHGRLFPLLPGNQLELRLSRTVELRDVSGRLLSSFHDRPVMTFRVLEQRSGHSTPNLAVHGDIFLIEQLITTGNQVVRRELHFAPDLGAAVRIVEAGDAARSDAILTRWEPLR